VRLTWDCIHRSKILYFYYRCLVVIILTIATPLAWSLTPSTSFIKTSKLQDITNFRHNKLDVDLSLMPSEIKYSDLNSNSLKDIDDLLEAKKEYGKMFGFYNWTLKNKKIVEAKATKILLLQGSYKNAQGRNVSFIEMYWANQTQSGQILITSDTIELKPDPHEFLVI
jgi:hypothetical protein